MDPISGAWEFLKTNSAAIAPQLHLTIWALGLLAVAPIVRSWRREWSLIFSLAGLGISLIHLLTIWQAGAGPAFYDAVTLDAFARFFDLIFLISAILAVALSYRYLDIEDEQHGEYYALILFATVGMMFMAGALDLVTLFVGLELMSVSIYILVGFLRRKRRSNEASMKYFLLGAFSTGIILYGMSLLYGVTGSTNLQEIGSQLQSREPGTLAILGMFMMIAGLCFKVAAAPFHMWAPDAYEGAPTSITAFMSVAVKAAAFAIFFRIFYLAFPGLREIYMPVLAVIAIFTMTWGNVAAVTQRNVKRLLAYSSISHAGYVLMGLVAGTPYGLTASALYLLIYTFMNLGIWGIVLLLRREDIRGEEIDDFNGLFFKNAPLAILMLIFLLSLTGIPPLGGFIAKYFVFAAAIRASLEAQGTESTLLICMAVVAALNSVVALYYYMRLVVAMFFRTDFVPTRLSFSAGLILTLILTGILTVVMGVYPQPFIELARSASLTLI